MEATAWIIGLWLAFGATHAGLSSLAWRPRLVARLGERGFLGVYSALAFATFVPLCWVYVASRHAGPLLWSVALGAALVWVLYVAMGAAFVLVAAGLLQPTPASLGSSGDATVRGVHRLTRHPLFMGIGLFGALHLVLLPAVFASDAAFFVGFPLFSLLGCWHQDRRKLSSQGPAFRDFVAQTSFLPFLTRGGLQGVRELPPWVIAVGIASTVVLRWLHEPLFR